MNSIIHPAPWQVVRAEDGSAYIEDTNGNLVATFPSEHAEIVASRVALRANDPRPDSVTFAFPCEFDTAHCGLTKDEYFLAHMLQAADLWAINPVNGELRSVGESVARAKAFAMAAAGSVA